MLVEAICGIVVAAFAFIVGLIICCGESGLIHSEQQRLERYQRETQPLLARH